MIMTAEVLTSTPIGSDRISIITCSYEGFLSRGWYTE